MASPDGGVVDGFHEVSVRVERGLGLRHCEVGEVSHRAYPPLLRQVAASCRQEAGGRAVREAARLMFTSNTKKHEMHPTNIYISILEQ